MTKQSDKMQSYKLIQDSDHFSPSEFPEGALDHMWPGFVERLVFFREELGRLQPGAYIIPSPLPAAWFRMDGSERSRHYAVGRKSDAGDFFPHGCNIRLAYMLAVSMFGGVGFYLDTNQGIMFHCDLRPEQVLWCRHRGRYIYAHIDPNMFFGLLNDAR